MTYDPKTHALKLEASKELAATARRLQAEGYPVRVILSASLGLAMCDMAGLLGPAEAARLLREAAEICQRAADRGEVGPLAEAEVAGSA